MADRATVVVCDDEELIRWSIAEHLRAEGYRPIEASNGQEALDAIQSHAPALALIDLKMPVMDGLAALRKLRESGSDLPVIMITAHGAVDSAIEATRLGATAYLSKPFDLREISLQVHKALEQDRLQQEVQFLRQRRRSGYGDFIGQAPVLDAVFATLRRLEVVDAPTVLVLGESGTGKDVVARAIHAGGPRKDRVFMEVDCASLPETLIESELFGHERGAFTDAKTTKRGLLETAAGGVVFLDEIGELPLTTQVKFLRALENRTFRRVGGVANIRMDTAIIAATNRDLKEEVRQGRFREDLFFRLNVVPVSLPPLRDRAQDIPLLVAHFLDRFARSFNRPIPTPSGAVLESLAAYPWPGNVRELRNVLERMVILGSQDGQIEIDDLPPEIRWAKQEHAGRAVGGCPFVLPEQGVDLESVERGLVIQALERTRFNQSASARLLGISRYALRYRMEKYGMLDKDGRATP